MNISFDDFRQLLISCRSVRRFDAARPVGDDILRQLVECTRYCPSGRNLQPLRYRPVSTPEECAAVFPSLLWAGYLKDWDGPAPDERPTAYLVQCLDTTLTESLLCDDGLQLEAIALAARTLGISSCIIKAFNAPAIAEALSIPAELKPRYILALGYPKEHVVIEDLPAPSHSLPIEYWRTPDATHHVPKRPLSDLLIPTSK